MSGSTNSVPHPKVSVCIPTVDRVEFLRIAIASVAVQTWRDFEIVIADNSGSPEGQRRVDEVLAEFPELTFVLKRHPVQVEAADNFMSLIDTARGELWVCLTDDDRMRPTFLQRSVEALERHPGCAFTFADHWIITADGAVDQVATDRNSAHFARTNLKERVYGNHDLFEIALRNSMCFQTAMFRRPVIASLRLIRGNIAGDYSFFMRLCSDPRGFSGYYIDERLFEYRVHAGQVTTTTNRATLLEAQIAALESVKSVPATHDRALRRKLSRYYLALGLLEAENGKRTRARAYARKSLGLALTLPNVAGGALIWLLPSGISHLRRLRS